jgi:hypothetical protein
VFEDPQRLARLAADMSRRMLPFQTSGGGIRGQTVDIEYAMTRCGFVHRFNRPLPGEPMPSVDEVVDRVAERLAHSRSPSARSIARSAIQRIARSEYLAVEPWPFAALVR